MKIVELEHTLKNQHLQYLSTWKEEEIVPYISKVSAKNYEEWFKKMLKFKNQEELKHDEVASTLFFLLNDQEEIVGCLHVRHYLNESLLIRGGHIGYGVSPLHRGKGYATLMTKFALEFLKTRGEKNVLLTCDDTNKASAAVIEKCGGVLENIVFDDNRQVYARRYWIKNI